MKVTDYKEAKGINVNHRKEQHFQDQYSFITTDLVEVIACRVYGTRSRNYCCLWIHDAETHAGSGFAGGCGYHRPSAAMAEALSVAGITLNIPIDGRGESSMIEAIEAIAEHNGWTGKVFHSHG